MLLSDIQLRYIRDAIINVSRVKYQDFFEEIYDHYVTGIEAQMADGMGFEEAFVRIHGAFLDLEYTYVVKFLGVTTNRTTYYGLEGLQMEYLANLQKHMRLRHWELLKNLFRWPTLVTTVLIGILALLVIEIIPKNRWLNTALIIAAYLPVIIMLPFNLNSIWRYIIRKRHLLNSAKEVSITTQVFMLSYITWFIPQMIVNTTDIDLWNAIPSPLIAGLLFWYALVAISFLQLYREQFKINLA